MKVAIFGSGGLGAYYGARLAEAGHDVGFIARGEHLQAIKQNGLTVNSPLGDVLLKPVVVSSDAADLGHQDLVIVAVKTWQLEDAANAMKPLMADNTMVVPFLNGIEAPETLARVLGKQHVLGGLSRVFSKIEAPGVIRHFNDSAYVEFGELEGNQASQRCTDLQKAFQQAGIEAEISSDIGTSLWRKLILVSSWGGLGALNQSTMGDLRKCPGTRELISACAGESVAVARAEGYSFPENIVDELWAFYDSLPEEASTSLSRDLLEGRVSELEAWHGVIVRLAEKHGIAAPNQRFVYHALQPMQSRNQSGLKSSLTQ